MFPIIDSKWQLNRILVSHVLILRWMFESSPRHWILHAHDMPYLFLTGHARFLGCFLRLSFLTERIDLCPSHVSLRSNCLDITEWMMLAEPWLYLLIWIPLMKFSFLYNLQPLQLRLQVVFWNFRCVRAYHQTWPVIWSSGHFNCMPVYYLLWPIK